MQSGVGLALRSRLSDRCSRGAPKVLANSLPKAGTNLLLHLLSLFPGMARRPLIHVDANTTNPNGLMGRLRAGQYMSGHLNWSQSMREMASQNDVQTLLIMRDPRDVVCSFVPYVADKSPDHRLHQHFKSLKDREQQLLTAIQGSDGSAGGSAFGGIRKHLEGFWPWIEDPSCLVVRFEDLVGPKGGGDASAQLSTLKKIAAHLGIQIAPVNL